MAKNTVETKTGERVEKPSAFREYAEALVMAVVLALFIRTFVVQAFKIPSGSMIPTLLIGDHLLVNKLLYRFRMPERGEVAVFMAVGQWYEDFGQTEDDEVAGLLAAAAGDQGARRRSTPGAKG